MSLWRRLVRHLFFGRMNSETDTELILNSPMTDLGMSPDLNGGLKDTDVLMFPDTLSSSVSTIVGTLESGSTELSPVVRSFDGMCRAGSEVLSNSVEKVLGSEVDDVGGTNKRHRYLMEREIWTGLCGIGLCVNFLGGVFFICVCYLFCMVASGDPLSRSHNLLGDEDQFSELALPGPMTRSKQRALVHLSVRIYCWWVVYFILGIYMLLCVVVQLLDLYLFLFCLLGGYAAGVV